LARLILLLFALFLLLVVLRGLRIFFAAVFRSGAAGRGAGQPGSHEEVMVRDPVCGVWIDRRLALSARRGGETIPVCSEKCLNQLEAAR
jgi:YHS domain-containing protein